MPTSEVILTESIRGLGAEADIVKVKRGFARNFLLPKGKAYEVTPITLKRINGLENQARRAGGRPNAMPPRNSRGASTSSPLHLTLETGATGKAFGSISVRDIEEALKKELPNANIDRHAIQLEKPIKETGLQEIPIKLYPEVTATLKVQVKSSVEQAPAAEAVAPAGDVEGGRKPVSKYAGKKKT